MIDYSEVGKRIKYYRQKRGLTQEQLAFDIHTSAAFQSTSPTAKESDRHSIVFSVEDKKTLTESLFTIIKILDRYS